jgi:hypothetical protein
MANRYREFSKDRHQPLVSPAGNYDDMEDGNCTPFQAPENSSFDNCDDVGKEQKKARRRGVCCLFLSIASFVMCFYASAACTVPAILCAIKGYLSAKRRRLADSELMSYWACALSFVGCFFGVGIAALYGFLAGVQAVAYHIIINNGPQCSPATQPNT